MAVALIGVINALVWPLLARLTLRLMVLTAGLLTLVLNGALLLGVAELLPGFAVSGLGDAVLASLILTAVNIAVSGLLAIDDDGSFYNAVIRRGAGGWPGPRRPTGRACSCSRSTGCPSRACAGRSRAATCRRSRAGWTRAATGCCHGSATSPCQTSASQAGILLGDNTDIPAFRWYDKGEGRIVVSSSGADCAALEKRLSDGDGLLVAGGVSVGNLVSGDAPRSLFTFSTASLRNRPPKDLLGLFANPYGVARIVTLMLRELAAERWWALRQRLRDEQPRIKRDAQVRATRAGVTIALRDLSVATLMANLFAGTRVAYATFFGYDEVAHHSGIERGDAFRALRGIDRQFARLERAAALAPRPYEFVVLADHGQSQGATFLQRYGLTLEDVVRGALTEPHTAGDMGPAEEARAGIGSALTEVADEDGMARGWPTSATPDEAPDTEGARAVVLASGNMGLVYLTEGEGRLTLEQIDELHPDLVRTLVEHDGRVVRARARRAPRAAGAQPRRQPPAARRPRGGHRPAGAVRAQRRRPPAAPRRLRAHAGRAGQLDLRPRDRGGGGVRGAGGLARRARRAAGAPVRGGPQRMGGARRADRGHRRAARRAQAVVGSRTSARSSAIRSRRGRPASRRTILITAANGTARIAPTTPRIELAISTATMVVNGDSETASR